MVQVKTPWINLMMEWHQAFMKNKKFIIDGKLNMDLINETGAPARYGIRNIEELLSISNYRAKL